MRWRSCPGPVERRRDRGELAATGVGAGRGEHDVSPNTTTASSTNTPSGNASAAASRGRPAQLPPGVDVAAPLLLRQVGVDGRAFEVRQLPLREPGRRAADEHGGHAVDPAIRDRCAASPRAPGAALRRVGAPPCTARAAPRSPRSRGARRAVANRYRNMRTRTSAAGSPANGSTRTNSQDPRIRLEQMRAAAPRTRRSRRAQRHEPQQPVEAQVVRRELRRRRRRPRPACRGSRTPASRASSGGSASCPRSPPRRGAG